MIPEWRMPDEPASAASADEHRAMARALRMRASMARDPRDIERLVLLARRCEKLALIALSRTRG
jgi:cytochrome c-type biogenesis protein CcmH/NrfG